MKEIVFMLEEESAANCIRALWGKMFVDRTDIRPVYICFEGKQDLEKELPRKLSGYRNSEASFIVLRDQDSGDCLALKKKLTDICHKNSHGRPYYVRIACHELESWFLAQLEAVERAYDIPGLAGKQGKRKYRQPDNLNNACQELESATNYQYSKKSGARLIGNHLNPEGDRSGSYKHFIAALRKLVG